MKLKSRIKAGSRGSVSFSRSLRALEADSSRRSLLGLLLVSALGGAWLAWFLCARVAIYEVTDTARLEVDWAVHPTEAPVAGRVVATRLVLGQAVQAGDTLVELEFDPQRLQLEQERTQRAVLVPQLQALRDEIAAEEKALGEEQKAARVAFDEARARYQEADTVARLAEVEAERLTRLHADGLLAEIDLLRAQAEAQRHRAAADALKLAVKRSELDQQTRESDRRVRVERLKQEITRLEGQRATSAATIGRLEYEIERRIIRAPVAGRLAEVAPLRVGGYVREGDKLATVVSPGTLKVMADFLPPAAFGRLRSGQPARLRLHGFPWAQYGSLAATVTGVASELRDGRVRVELIVGPHSTPRIPLQHGLPGTVEVEVERIAPAALVLRTAGKFLGEPRPAYMAGSRPAVGR